MTRAQVFPSKYLGKDDVPGPFMATIAEVTLETLTGGERGDETKAVIHFQDGWKPLILNQGNWLTIEEHYGPESDGWKGKLIEVYVDSSVMFGGKRVGGIRVRVPTGTTAAVDLWTLDKAISEAHKVGIDRNAVIAAIKAAGGSGWQPARDTPLIKAIVAKAATQEQSFDTQPASDTNGTAYIDKEIPF